MGDDRGGPGPAGGGARRGASALARGQPHGPAAGRAGPRLGLGRTGRGRGRFRRRGERRGDRLHGRPVEPGPAPPAGRRPPDDDDRRWKHDPARGRLVRRGVGRLRPVEHGVASRAGDRWPRGRDRGLRRPAALHRGQGHLAAAEGRRHRPVGRVRRRRRRPASPRWPSSSAGTCTARSASRSGSSTPPGAERPPRRGRAARLSGPSRRCGRWWRTSTPRSTIPKRGGRSPPGSRPGRPRTTPRTRETRDSRRAGRGRTSTRRLGADGPSPAVGEGRPRDRRGGVVPPGRRDPRRVGREGPASLPRRARRFRHDVLLRARRSAAPARRRPATGRCRGSTRFPGAWSPPDAPSSRCASSTTTAAAASAGWRPTCGSPPRTRRRCRSPSPDGGSTGSSAASPPSTPDFATQPRYPSPDNPNSPTVLYGAMIAPLTPFAIRGAIWYQGESNADAALQYRTLFPDHDPRLAARVGPRRLPVPLRPARELHGAGGRAGRERVGRAARGAGDDARPAAGRAWPWRSTSARPATSTRATSRTWAPGSPAGRSPTRTAGRWRRAVRSTDRSQSKRRRSGFGSTTREASPPPTAPLRRASPSPGPIAGGTGPRRGSTAKTVVVSSPDVPQPVAVRYALGRQPRGHAPQRRRPPRLPFPHRRLAADHRVPRRLLPQPRDPRLPPRPQRRARGRTTSTS